MLRTYIPIVSQISQIHVFMNFVVCDYWCNAEEEFSILFPKEYQSIFKKLPVFRSEVIRIYQLCSGLSPVEKLAIKNAFFSQNRIEALCNAKSTTEKLDKLPSIVVLEMKSFLIDIYEEYSERKTLTNEFTSKQHYYSELIEKNRFQFCPSCGITRIFAYDFSQREDFDHYLPKSLYPFTSVNYQNLVPICKYCNSTFKKDNNPIQNNRKAFYPYLGIDNQISINPNLGKDILDKVVNVAFTGDSQEEIDTWNDIFVISKRYSSLCNDLKREIIERVKKRSRLQGESIEESFIFYKGEYEFDKYIECNFLRIPIIDEFLNRDDLLEQLNDA